MCVWQLRGLFPSLSRSRDEELLVLCFQSCGTHPWSVQQSYLMLNLQTAKKMMEIRPHPPARIQLWCKWEWLTPSPSPFPMRLSAGGSLNKSSCDMGEQYSLCSGQLHVFSPRDAMEQNDYGKVSRSLSGLRKHPKMLVTIDLVLLVDLHLLVNPTSFQHLRCLWLS